MEFTPTESIEYDSNNAIAYMRVSSNGQVTDGDGILSQEKACAESEKNLGYNIKQVFKDEAISGKITDRPGLLSALNYLEEQNKKSGTHNIKYFMCTEVSRISRPEFLDEGMAICQRIWERGAVIYDVFSKDTYARGDDMKIIQLMFKLYAAKQERENGALRATNGMRQRLLDGYRPFCRPPAGYRNIKIKTGEKKKNAIAVLDEPHATVIKNALKLYASGELYNAHEFLNYLRENYFRTNSPTTAGIKIHNSLFQRLTEPRKLYFYAGYIVYPKWEITEPIQGKHEAIITDDELKNILVRLNHAYEKRPLTTITNSKEEFPLRSILKCKACKKPMYGSFARGKKGTKYPYYECKNKECLLKEMKISRSCPRETVHTAVESALSKFQGNTQLLSLVEELSKEILGNKLTVHHNKIKATKSHIITLRQAKNRYEEKMVDPDFQDKELQNTFKAKWKESKQQIAESEYKLIELEDSEKSYEHLPEIRETIRNPLSIWNNNDTDTKLLLLKVLFNGDLQYQKNEGLRTPHSLVPMRDMVDMNTNNNLIWALRDSNPGPSA